MARPLDELADALDRAADFVVGVVGLAQGHLGGGPASPSRRARLTAGFVSWFGAGSEASRLAASHGHEQLRKAALEADRAVTALESLRRDPGWATLVAQLDELGTAALPERLREVDPRSPRLRSVYLDLQRTSGVVVASRTRRSLAERHRREGM